MSDFSKKIDDILSNTNAVLEKLNSPDRLDSSVDKAKIVVEHYHDCHEVIRDFWRERNKLFIYILIAVAIGLLLSTTVEGTNAAVSLIGAFLAKSAGATSIDSSSFISADLVRALIPLPIFYLVFNLYQRDIYIRRGYFYMQVLEDFVRDSLEITEGAVFTKEGKFYKDKETFAQRSALLFYHLLVLLLLSIFYSYRIEIDLMLMSKSGGIGNAIVILVDIILAGATSFYMSAYSCASHALVSKDFTCIPNEKRCMTKWILAMGALVLLGIVLVYISSQGQVNRGNLSLDMAGNAQLKSPCTVAVWT